MKALDKLEEHLKERLTRKISIMRKSGNYIVDSKDFVGLNHGSFLADKKVMIDILESYIQEIRDSGTLPKDGPRILFTGSTLARGDSKVMDIKEDSGGIIVMEEFAEGIRPYWGNVRVEGDLMFNLAES